MVSMVTSFAVPEPINVKGIQCAIHLGLLYIMIPFRSITPCETMHLRGTLNQANARLEYRSVCQGAKPGRIFCCDSAYKSLNSAIWCKVWRQRQHSEMLQDDSSDLWYDGSRSDGSILYNHDDDDGEGGGYALMVNQD